MKKDEFDYREKDVEALSDRIGDLIAEEFDKTKDLGPIHHFMAFCNLYVSLVTFFLGLLTETDEDCEQILDILHENDEKAIAIMKELRREKKKLN